jgi:hypothetical protein
MPEEPSKRVGNRIRQILESDRSDNCKRLALYGLALKLMPQSINQKAVDVEIDKLNRKLGLLAN